MNNSRITPHSERVKRILDLMSMELMGKQIRLVYRRDKKGYEGPDHPHAARIYLQIRYDAPCTKTGEMAEFRGRKWYLSEHMTDDEIVKTAWLAFETAVRHELLEGFRMANVPVFNPHTPFDKLIQASKYEETRVDQRVSIP